MCTWLYHRERRPHLVSEHQFSGSSTSRAVWRNTVLLEEFSQSQMFRLLFLSHNSFHGLFENTYEPFRFTIRCRVKLRRSYCLDGQSCVHCTSQQTSLLRTVDHCQIRPSQAGSIIVNFRTYGNFECASITTNHMSSSNGPAKSM